MTGPQRIIITGGPGSGKTSLIEALAAAGEVVTDYESEWLEKMVAADGEVDELESRLIARLAAEV